jgi:hypothetical protein
MPLRSEPRFPKVAREAGHYESFYLKASKDGTGVWIRHTVHKRPGEEPKASIWFTLFDHAADEPWAHKVTVPASELGSGPDEYIHVDGASLTDGHAAGSCGDASWELDFGSQEPPFRHLARDWMYGAKLPKTKLLSPYPAAAYSGTVKVGEKEVRLDGWPGMVGHNWGSEHAERWIWMHGAGFDGHGPDTWFDAGVGRIKIGPVTTPWLGNAMLALDGEHHRLGGPERVRSTEIADTPEGCEFRLTGKGIDVHGTVRAPRKDFVGWVYADPDGPEHNTVNCSIADMRLAVSRKDRPDVVLEVKGAAAYELGMRETDHGMKIQPFPDG